MQKLLLSVSDTVTVLDADGRVTTTTSTGKPVLGYPSEWWEGRSITDLAHPDDLEQGAELLAEVLDHPGEEFETEVRVRHAEGHYEWIRLVAVNQLDDPDLLGIVVTTRNISHHKQTEQGLMSSRDSALALAEDKSDYVANVSHEIRSPLHAILGFAELLESQLQSEGRGQAAEWSSRICSETGRLARLIEDLLDLARLDAGRTRIKSETFQLRHRLRHVVEMARMKAEEKGVHLSVSVDPSVSDWRNGDQDRLQQVLLNLVANATKFTRQGRIDIDASPSTKAGSHDSVRFAVTDTGPGIPSDELDRIFEPFSQVSSADAASGSGLGLPISARLVTAMGGEGLSVSSLEGHGTTFYFELPLPMAKEPAPARTVETVGGTDDLNVLVVDDNPTNRMLVEAQLLRLGCRCELAPGGSEALKRLESGGIDLVLMDCNMPGMDGFETTRRIRVAELGSHDSIPVLALTASALGSTRDACERAGMNGFLAKPVVLSDLADELFRFAGRGLVISPATTSAEEQKVRRLESTAQVLDEERVERMLEELGTEVMEKVSNTFLSEAPGRLAEIRRVAAEGDSDTIRRSVHALRSPSAMLGAAALAEELRVVEESADPLASLSDSALEHLLELSTAQLRERIGILEDRSEEVV
jgi:PAS domain S-box-containing protein